MGGTRDEAAPRPTRQTPPPSNKHTSLACTPGPYSHQTLTYHMGIFRYFRNQFGSCDIISERRDNRRELQETLCGAQHRVAEAQLPGQVQAALPRNLVQIRCSFTLNSS